MAQGLHRKWPSCIPNPSFLLATPLNSIISSIGQTKLFAGNPGRCNPAGKTCHRNALAILLPYVTQNITSSWLHQDQMGHAIAQPGLSLGPSNDDAIVILPKDSGPWRCSVSKYWVGSGQRAVARTWRAPRGCTVGVASFTLQAFDYVWHRGKKNHLARVSSRPRDERASCQSSLGSGIFSIAGYRNMPMVFWVRLHV